ncbi:ubiquitin ligase E3 alpha, putative [Entamoeba invadens IP1]|uniref:E3 ubiquitin-protein ligase n=1 Tax=Entamoeba invadens IP1 TaxID=370355 RepID=A0A0A1U3G8_ENTIV|nr:ubiquitin ligase E3 alpha, putative [Entamoeba invadens IP1]ELP87293.1 ubiquitin ligase E3 alpha, putative [Entamoeba invadens IP1]|eukprot:XP_004254064.1 ubiquitin ligase E3 alpha, putative [Entamoeba invadens IP1]
MEVGEVEAFWRTKFSIPLKDVVNETKDIIPPMICPKQNDNKRREIIYRCKTCAKSNSSCICSLCFSEGNHVGHDYYAYATSGTFTCDCGNTEAWKSSGFCKRHGVPFNGDLEEKIPEKYKRIGDIIVDFLNQIVSAKDPLDDTQVELCTLQYLIKSNLFFLLVAEKCNTPTKNERSPLAKEFGRDLCYFELLFEVCFTVELKTDYLRDFLVKYISRMDLFKFPTFTILHLTLNLLKNDFPIKNLLQDFVFSFISTHPNDLVNDFFKTNLFVKLLEHSQDIYTSIYKNTKVIEIPPKVGWNEKQVDNFVDFVVWFIEEHPVTHNIEFSKEVFEKIIAVLKITSNVLPIMIKTGDHVEYDNMFFEMTSFYMENALDFAFVIRDLATTENLKRNFEYIHDEVMKVVRKYLVDVPVIEVNNVKVHKRLCGENQPVSPISNVLSFYTYVLLRLHQDSCVPKIEKTDAELLVEHVILSRVFVSQFIQRDWVRNGSDAEQQFSTYVSLFYEKTFLLDLTLVQFLLPIVGVKFFISTCVTMFKLINFSDKTLYTYADVNFSPINFYEMMRFVVEICRCQKITNTKVTDGDWFQIIIAQFTAAGITNPATIASQTPFENLPLEKHFDAVCVKKGVIRKEYLDQIDPVFPLFGQIHREALMKATLYEKNSIKPNRYKYVFVSSQNIEGVKLLLQSEEIVDFFCGAFKQYKASDEVVVDISQMFLLFLFDSFTTNNNVASNVHLADKLNDLGCEFAGLSVCGISEFFDYVKGPFYEGYMSALAVKSKNSEEVSEEKIQETKMKNTAKNIRKHLLEKMKNKQRTFSEQMKYTKAHPKEQQLVQPITECKEEKIEEKNEDECVICQCHKNSITGRFIDIFPNGAVELERLKEGGLTSCQINVNTCKHRVHKECYLEILKDRDSCPVCLKKFGYFLPDLLVIENAKGEEEINELLFSLSQLEFEEWTLYEGIIWMIHSTVSSLELCTRSGNYVIDEDDKYIVNTLMALGKKLGKCKDGEDLLTVAQEHMPEKDPFFLYILLRCNSIPTSKAIECAKKCGKEILNKELAEIDTTTVELDMKTFLYENGKKAMQVFFDVTNLLEDIMKSGVFNENTGVDENEEPNVVCCTKFGVGSKPFTLEEIPDNYEDVVLKYSKEVCEECQRNIGDVLEKRVCLICGKILCPGCSVDHFQKCSMGYGIYFDISKGMVCLMQDVSVRGIVVYENKYGDKFKPDIVQIGQFSFVSKNYEIFMNALRRGSIFQDETFVDLTPRVYQDDEGGSLRIYDNMKKYEAISTSRRSKLEHEFDTEFENLCHTVTQQQVVSDTTSFNKKAAELLMKFPEIKRYALEKVLTFSMENLSDATTDKWVDAVLRAYPLDKQLTLKIIAFYEERGQFEEIGELLDACLPHCDDENIITKAITWWEKLGKYNKIRRMLENKVKGKYTFKNISNIWKLMFEGATFESRIGAWYFGIEALKFVSLKKTTGTATAPLYYEYANLNYKMMNYEEAKLICKIGLKYAPKYIHLLVLLIRSTCRIYDEKTNKSKDLKEALQKEVSGYITEYVGGLSNDVQWKAYLEAAMISFDYEWCEMANNYLQRCLECSTPNTTWKTNVLVARHAFTKNVALSAQFLKNTENQINDKQRGIPLMERAHIAEISGKFKEACEVAENIIEVIDDWKYSIEAIMIYVRCGRVDDAYSLCCKIVKEYPSTGRVWGLYVMLSGEKGDAVQKKAFELALKNAPKSGEVWCEGARMEIKKGNFYLALVFLHYAMVFTPQYGDIYVELIRLVIYTKDYSMVKTIVTKCVNGQPNYGFLWTFYRGDDINAIVILKNVLKNLRCSTRRGIEISPVHVYEKCSQYPHEVRARMILGSELFKA